MEFRQTTVRIGRRDANDIRIDDVNVSGRHGEIRMHPEGLVYLDLGSTNGSFVRRESQMLAVDDACHRRVALRPGDQLLFGDATRPLVLEPVRVVEADEPPSAGNDTALDLAEVLDASNASVMNALSQGMDRATLLMLHRFTGQAVGELDFDQLLHHFADAVLGLFSQADRISVYVRSESDEFVPVLSRNRDGICPYERVSRTLRRAVLEDGKAVLFASSDPVFRDASSLHRARISVGLCAPLRARSEVLGFAQIDSRGKLVPFSPTDLQVFTVFSQQLGLLLANERLNRGLHTTVTELERARREMEKLAFADALTGLANRRLFRDRLGQAVRMGQRTGRPCAVLYLDLDDFKRVNDSLGHDAGDRLLCVIAKRLRACVRAPDTVARIGGDEFALLLTEVNGAEGALLVAEKVLAAVREPVDLDARRLVLSTSIGITLAPADAADAESLLRNADLALYRSKHRGPGGAQFYDEEMERDASLRLLLEQDLREAIPRSELLLHYQPVWRFSERATVAVEALLRWQHPSRGMLLPDAFVRLAEESGLIEPLGEWVLGRACRELAHAASSGRRMPMLAVNVSARELTHGSLVANCEKALRDTGTDARALQLEITESMLMENLQESRETLIRLRKLGISVAIDDFGTGYSSLSYLKELPVDTLKIDRHFVHAIGQTQGDGELAAAIVAMGRTLGLSVVAEGIESRAQLEFLRASGCDLGQGFLLGRPQQFDPRWMEGRGNARGGGGAR